MDADNKDSQTEKRFMAFEGWTAQMQTALKYIQTSVVVCYTINISSYHFNEKCESLTFWSTDVTDGRLSSACIGT